mgnify:CR=1 FL=1
MNEISIEQAKETHDALREILIKYGLKKTIIRKQCKGGV